MRHGTSVLRWAALLLTLTLGWSTATPLPAQQRIPQDALVNVAELEQVLRVGEQLEREQRWGEALAHYEEAVRQHPGRADLEQRLKLARLHYELARRYHDRSYLASVRQISEFDALDLYGEVLLKIHAHYVENVNWKKIARGGARALQVALKEPDFRATHGLSESPERVDEHGLQVARMIESYSLNSRHDARECASRVARLTQQEIGLPASVVLMEFACAAGASLDAYSAFLTGDQLDDVLSQIEGNFVGLGIELKAEDQALLIVNVIPQGPADAAQIRAGDRIVEVDGKSMRDISTDAAADMLKGLDGSPVSLSVVAADGSTRSVRLRRRRVDVPSVEDASLVDAQHGIAYLRLTSFQKTTGRDVDAALWKLHRLGMRCLIIDLRGNPGGLLTASVDVADKFVSYGPIVATRGRSSGEDNDYKARLMGTWRVPLVVLIDGDSASASEVFAGAIRDHKRGTIVGSRSYGKGSVQGIFPLNFGDAGLRLTTARFYSPSGRAISQRGVQPDMTIHAVAKPVVGERTAEDAVLRAGIQVAMQKLARG
jgi:carboxyl-terminal processing protease